MTKIDLIKKLLPGLLPLFVFIVADEVWGTEVGLIVAVAFGIIQLGYTWIREKRFDKFVLFDVGLIVILGIVSILLENDIFFKLKPALIGFMLVALLGISAFSPNNIMLLMSKRYMQGIEINDEQVKQFNRSLRIMFFLFLAHTLLVVYSAFYMSKEAWAFISGGLFYILFGVYFVYEFARNRIKANRYRNEEWLPVVDDDGNVKGKMPRSLCHKGRGNLHPVVHMHVINSKKMIYLQKRSMKKSVHPGKWDTAVGGHVGLNDTIEKGLQREAREELGLTDFKVRFVEKYKWETDVESELVFMFVTIYNGQINYNREEIEDGKYWTIKQVRNNLGKDIFTPNFEYEFEILEEKIL